MNEKADLIYQIPENYEFSEVVGGNIICKPKVAKIKISAPIAMEVYNNGDPIPYAFTTEEWRYYGKNKIGCRCLYNNDYKNLEFGYLYNHYALMDERGIECGGWKLPTLEDFEKYEDLFESALKHEEACGFRDYLGTFVNFRRWFIWGKTSSDLESAKGLYVGSYYVNLNNHYMETGLSVRLIKKVY